MAEVRLAHTRLPFKLRQYQREAVSEFLKARKGTIIMPTGSGKTAIAVECMRRLRVNTAILVPTEALMFQWCKKLRESGVYTTRFYAKEKVISTVTVFIYDSAVSYIHKLRTFNFIIVDEVHHLGASVLSNLLDVVKEKPYALGLTSCIRRSDGRQYLIKKVMPVIYQMFISEAQKRGFVSSLRVFRVPAKMTPDERTRYIHYTETIRRALRILRVNSIADLTKINHPLARACLSAIAKRKVLLSNVQNKKQKVLKIALKHSKEKILLFSESIRSVEAIKGHLRGKGLPCGVYHSEMPIDHRRRNLTLWKEGTFNIMLSCRCLEEGIDVPTVRVGVIIASSSTDRQFIQRIGRLMRIRLDKSEGVIYVVYCQRTVEQSFAHKIRWLLENR